jgi:tetratricopeptide (TPR) repeat protein
MIEKMLTASNPTDIPTIHVNENRGEATGLSLDELSTSLLKSLTQYPYYAVVNGFSPIKDPKKLELLLRAIRAKISPQTGINKENFNSLSFTRVSVTPPAEDGKATQVSLTHAALPPHTDSAYDLLPHEMVVFHCVEADENGGRTLMVPIDHVLKHLSDDVITRLREPVYPFGQGRYPILFGDQDFGDRTDNQSASFMRYYNVQLRHASIQNSVEFTPAHRAALDTLDNLLENQELYHLFHLQPGQILFMHNQKTLHGRTALSQGTHRILYRMRLSVASLSANEQMTIAANDAQTHLALAKALEWLGRLEQALHHYRQASELAPQQPDALAAYQALLSKTDSQKSQTSTQAASVL